jgi:hypothetical protein
MAYAGDEMWCGSACGTLQVFDIKVILNKFKHIKVVLITTI